MNLTADMIITLSKIGGKNAVAAQLIVDEQLEDAGMLLRSLRKDLDKVEQEIDRLIALKNTQAA
jgi:hypothetical protein